VKAACGLKLENQPVPALASQSSIARLEYEPRRPPHEDRRLSKVVQQGLLDVVGLTDIDPLARVRDSEDT
jgi:hypothetical protein